MATLNLDVLEAAHKDGLLPKRLTAHQKLYLHSSIQTANSIYWEISKADSGLNVEQLQNAVSSALESPKKINQNTLFQYTRWLEFKGVIFAEGVGIGDKHVYFTKKQHTIVRAKK